MPSHLPYVSDTPLTERDLAPVARLFGFRSLNDLVQFGTTQQDKANGVITISRECA